MLNAATPFVCPAPIAYTADEPAVAELEVPITDGPDRGVPLANVQLPNCVMPVQLSFTSAACRNVPRTGLRAFLKVIGTITVMVLGPSDAEAAARFTVH